MWKHRDLLLHILSGTISSQGLPTKQQQMLDRALCELRQSANSRFTATLKQFLSILIPENTWMLDLSLLFDEMIDIALRLARQKPSHGTLFFRLLRQKKLGNSPEQIQYAMNCVKHLLPIGESLSVAFLRGYHHLVGRLSFDEIDRYIQEAISCYEVNRQMGQDFLEGRLNNSEAIIQNLLRECRLEDVATELEKLLLALTGKQVAVEPLRHIHPYSRIDRSPRMLCLYRWLYLPGRLRYEESRQANKQWYLLQCIVAAGMLCQKSFPVLHGHPDYTGAADLVGHSCLSLNLFLLIEYVRVVQYVRKRWPGSRALVNYGLQQEYKRMAPTVTSSEQLFFDVVRGESHSSASVRLLLELTGRCRMVFETAEVLKTLPTEIFVKEYPACETQLFRTMRIFPDFLYPLVASAPPSDEQILDLQRQDLVPQALPTNESMIPNDPECFLSRSRSNDGETALCYVYDEWSQDEHLYLRKWCYVYETIVQTSKRWTISQDVLHEGQKIKRLFEVLRPDETGKEKRLPEGDMMNESLLVEYIIASKQEPCPKVEFFERPSLKKRNIAVLLLLDVSGSTGESAGGQKAIDIEKQAALILGQGLAALEDTFSICGFSSNGREHCDFQVFKDFEDPWDRDSMSRILSAQPTNTTRMGAALRHAGNRLRRLPARQKLILLITDGKPLDQEYSSQTRYAQHDVRMASLENTRRGIATFCISTLENSRSDMELMFPNQRFVILNTIQQLTHILPKFYIKLTL
ncbi:hypothetical protein CSA56_11500 [candidate division KSB3 bacterium]|uniref:VWFA domain-containing protein n=1 Tax=candidate division KSB3 bacterium TaxID=2044937 RepID=A0A2G6KCY4_9BACT|nr:MAG: hypothetical protein CSA56_11500 [candidate division KSB3 bacterium]